MISYQEILKQYWGYDDFRGIQREIIESIGSGHDTLGLMPTGGGKSITFQVPALCQDGTCIVITPLIALMKDQVDHLRRRGIRAAAIYSGLTREEIVITLENCIFGDIRILYVSPERLASDLFQTKLRHMRVSFITVDEAHCISQWGYDFRPSYLQIAQIRKLVPNAPVLALTATATPAVVQDIQQKLSQKDTNFNVFRMSFERKNLAYVVRHAPDKREQLIHILESVKGSAIVYARSRRRTKEYAELLTEAGISATFYHAGLDSAVKDERQRGWQQDKVRVMVATNAFGMGIDKPDVRLVIHYDLPDSIEAYFQEAGRAGRDGQQAWCVRLYSERDKAVVKQRIPNNYPPAEEVERVYQLLCDYLTIGLGSGRDATFALDVEQFCTDMHLPFLTTYSALQLLTNAGYIIYNDEQDLQPRVRITLDKEDLYHLDESPFQERLLSALMRRYTGIFTEAQFIHLPRLAEDLGSTEFAVNSSLIALAKQHIIRYIPAQRVSIVHFPVPRQAEVNLSARVYADRRKVFADKLQAMLEYAENDHYCRSQLMLGYFGEPDAPVCGACDICIANRKAEVSNQQPKVQYCYNPV